MAKQMHDGHRERIRNRFLKNGLDGFAPHEILEFILTFAIPRRNTNDLAHNLIERFGSLSGVLEADLSEIVQVDGIGENSAILIKLFIPVLRKYLDETQSESKKYETVTDLAAFFIPFFMGYTKEVVAVMTLDASYHMIACDILNEGSVNSSNVEVAKLSDILYLRHGAAFVLAHNHPGASPMPSQNDIMLTRKLRTIFSELKRPLIEHIIVSGNEYSALIYDKLI